MAAATREVENTLSRMLSGLNGAMVVKWVAAFEYIAPDGTRAVASMAPNEMMKWDVAGLLTYVLKNDELDTLRQIIRGDDE